MKRIIQRIRQSYWLRSGAFTFLQRFSITFFGFLSFIILVRLLDVNDFGVWVLYVSFFSVIELVREGFIKNPLIRKFLSSEKENHPSIAGAAFFLNGCSFVMLLMVLVVLAEPISEWMEAPFLEPLLYLYIFQAFFYTFFLHFLALHEAHLNFKATFWAYFAQRLFFLLYLLLILFLNERFTVSLFSLAIVQIIAVAISTGIVFLYARNYSVYYFRMRWAYVRDIFNHGKYSLGTNMSSMILNNIDSWMLAGIISPAAVAIYNPALRITRLVEVPMSSVASITYPKLVQKDAKASLLNAKKLYEKSVSAILATMIPLVIGIILLADPIVTLIAGDKYVESAPVLQIVMLYGLVAPFNRQFGNTLDAIGKAHLTFYFVLLSALLNALLNFFMIQRMGVVGAAIATITTHTIGFVLRQLFLSRVLHVDLLAILRQTFVWYKFGINKAVVLSNKLLDA